MRKFARSLTCSLFRLHYLTRPNDFMPYFEVHIANEVSHFADTTLYIQWGHIQAVFVIATHHFGGGEIEMERDKVNE